MVPAALGAFAVMIGCTANASVVYEYSGTVLTAFKTPAGGSEQQAPQLVGSTITGFAELADEDFLPGANLVLSDLISWEFNWLADDNGTSIAASFSSTDGFTNNGAGAFSLDLGFEVDDWFWSGVDTAGNYLCIGCFGFGNTQHGIDYTSIEDTFYQVAGTDGAWTLVPLPASLPLLASGIAGFFFAAGRRRQGKHST